MKLDTKTLSMNDIWTYLSYVQALADKYEEMLKTVDWHIENSKVTESSVTIIRSKLQKGFQDADQITMQLESELDRRAKAKCGIVYGSKTLTTFTNEFYKILESYKEKPAGDAGKSKSKLQIK